MLQLSSDQTFHYELLRVLAATRGNAADIAEVLTVVEKITPGDFESWYQQFNKLASHIHSTAPDSRHPVSARNAMFRAANYYRTADFFLHGNPADPRIMELWDNQTACFDKAISLLEVPGERFEIKTAGFNIPAIFYKAAKDDKPRPVLLLCTGYDGSQEEMLHMHGFAALERGFNIITFEGPGQPTVVRKQKVGFITEWEKVVTPVVDYCQNIASIDSAKVILLGSSFGGFLAPRAAAFEHRLAAVVCVDGIYNVYESFTKVLPPALTKLLQENNKDTVDLVVKKAMEQSTKLRWSAEQGCWAFTTSSPYEFLIRTKSMTMENIAKNIQCPVLICEGEADSFFAGDQPKQLADAIGTLATLRILTAADAAQDHCHVGAYDFAMRVVMDWIEDEIL